MRRGSLHRKDGGVSDIMGTLLMAGAVVLAGASLTIVVAQQLSAPSPPSVALALAPLTPGDALASVILRNGETLNLTDLNVTLVRNATTVATIPRGAWTTPDPWNLRAGDTLSFALAPPAAPDESIHVRVVHTATNALLAEVSGRTGSSAFAAYDAASLQVSLTPGTIVADATSAALLAVRVSHPAGNLAVASVTADLSNLTNASQSANTTMALLDSGTLGDLLGGDGVYSGLVRASLNTTPGTYNITIHAVDVAGRASATSYALLGISSNLTTVIGNVTSAIGNATTAIGNFTNATGNFSGNCYGCVILGGSYSYEGTRLISPTSANVTSFKLRNWTYDRQNPSRLDFDVGVVRIISGGYAWSAHFTFEAYGQTNIPAVKRILMWDANRTSTYIPAGGAAYVAMNGLDLDMLNPANSGFTCETGCTAQATYQNASIQGRPGFVVAWLKDETNNFQTDELGIFAMDVILQ